MFNYSYTQRERLLFIAFLMAVGCLLRNYPMLGYYYNSDEMLHLSIASASSLKQVWENSLYETHPPLGHFIRHFWMMLGDSVWWNRCLSMIFGLVPIPLMYLCGKAVSGRQAGVIAAVITTFVPHAVTISNVVRNYSISAFFTASAILFFFKYAGKQKPKYFVYFAIFAVLSALTHYTNIIILFALMGAFSIKAIKKKNHVDLIRIACLGTFLAAITVFFVLQHGGKVDSYVSATPKVTEYFANPSYALEMAGQAVQFLVLLLISLFVTPSLLFSSPAGIILVSGIFISFAVAVALRGNTAGTPLLKQAFLISVPIVLVGAFTGFFGFSLIRRAYSVMQLGTLFIAGVMTSGEVEKVSHKIFITIFCVLIAAASIIAVPQDQRRIEATITTGEWQEFTKAVDAIKETKSIIYADLPVMVSLMWGRGDYYEFLQKYKPFENAAVYPLGNAEIVYRYGDVRESEAMYSLKSILKENPDKYENVVFVLLKLSEGGHVKMVRDCLPKLGGTKVIINNTDVLMVAVPSRVFQREIEGGGAKACAD